MQCPVDTEGQPRILGLPLILNPVLRRVVVVQLLSPIWLFCDPMDCSTPGFPILHHHSEFAQTHVHWVGDVIQPSHPLLSPSPPAFNLSHHQSLFQMSQLFTSCGQNILASVLPMNILDWFPLGLIGLISLQSRRLSKVFSSTTVRRHQFFFISWPLFLGFTLLGSRQKAQVFTKAHLTRWDFRFCLSPAKMAEKTSGNSLSLPASGTSTRTGRGCCLGPGSCLRVSTSWSFTPQTPLWPHRSCDFAGNGCFLLGLQTRWLGRSLYEDLGGSLHDPSSGI